MATPSQRTVPPSRVPFTEGLRAVAATMVMLAHVTFASIPHGDGIWRTALYRGDLAVPLFFGLSGLLLTRMWTRRRWAGKPYPGVRRYYKNRLTRILPAYYLALLVILLTYGRGSSPGTVVSNVLFLQVYTGDYLAVFPQTWSLCTEMAFYALVPLLSAWVASRRSIRGGLTICAGLGAVSVVSILIVSSGVPPAVKTVLGHSFLVHAVWFAAGMALALLEPRLRAAKDAWWQVPSLWIALMAGVFALTLSPLGGAIGLSEMPAWQLITKEWLYALFAFLFIGLLLLPATPGTLLGRFLDSPAMAWYGRISYSFFLWQMLVIWAVRDLLGMPLFTGGFWATLALAFPLSVVVAYGSWWCCERPFMSMVGGTPAAVPRDDQPAASPLPGTQPATDRI